MVFDGKASPTRFDWYNHYHYAQEHCLEHGLTPPEDISYYLNPWFSLYKGCENIVTLSLFPSKGTQLDKGLKIEEAESLCIDLKKLGYRPIQLGGNFEIKA